MRETLLTLFLYVALALLNSDLAYGNIVAWDFGRKVQGSYVLGHEVGKIPVTEKTVRIPLKVPKCHEVTAVRVEVENRISTPSVRYDEDAQVVTISYTLLSNSRSDYDILIKGRMIPGCGWHAPPPMVEYSREGKVPDVEYSRDGKAPKVEYSREGEVPDVEYSRDGKAPKVEYSREGKVPDLEYSHDGKAPKVESSHDREAPKVEYSHDGQTPKVENPYDGKGKPFSCDTDEDYDR